LRSGRLELEVEFAVAFGLHVLGEMVDALADRAGLDEAQEVRRRPGGLAAHGQQFLGLLEVGDLGAHLAQLDAEALRRSCR
jgi:hypothetical protein